MTANIRFPFPTATPAGASEANQIITLASAVSSILLGGPVTYTDVTAWKLNSLHKEAPYTGIVIEFKGTGAFTFGDGSIAQEIGLFGQIGLTGTDKYLLGVLGLGLGNTMPQVPIISATIGFAQVVCNIALYDRIAIGGIAGVITVPGEADTITIRARPIRRRDYMG